MNKFIKNIIITTVCFFIIGYVNSYADNEKTNLELLIVNKENQDEIKEKINATKENIKQKEEYINKVNNTEKNEIEVISISFIQDEEVNKDDIIKEEIENLNNDKSDLEKELENLIIEGVRLEKTLEDEKSDYLSLKGKSFIKGIWPLEEYKDISSDFGERIHPITNEVKFHRGIDIPAPENTDVLASDDGVVIFSGNQNGYGNIVKIKHFDGKKTIYAHNTSNMVQEGDIVKRGQVIAKVGSTGNSTGNHVHFEVVLDGENVNPVDCVDK